MNWVQKEKDVVVSSFFITHYLKTAIISITNLQH
jgi:hypothetical protein